VGTRSRKVTGTHQTSQKLATLMGGTLWCDARALRLEDGVRKAPPP